MKPIDFHPDAAQEAQGAANCYEGIRAGLGADFRAALDAALSRIRQNPAAYAQEAGNIRLCPLHGFPFSVFYEELTNRIWVAAVGHHSRRPFYWSRRHP